VEPYVVEEYFRQFIKTVMANLAPISWLFVWQTFLGIRFDGVGFWSIYAVFTILVAIGVWFVNGRSPNPGSLEGEIPTPVFGIVTATYQPVVFLATLALYEVLWKR
jgi:hypothetical protein